MDISAQKLIRLAHIGSQEEVLMMLQTKEPDWVERSMVTRDPSGWLALHHAAFNNHLSIVQTLLDFGAQINSVTEIELRTPLHFAALNDRVELVEYLLENGADPTIADVSGKSPIDLTFDEKIRKTLQKSVDAKGRILRFIPVVRKLIANKFLQRVLNVLLVVFLEIFKDNLKVVLAKVLQIVVLLQPSVLQVVVAVLTSLTPLFSTVNYIVAPIFRMISYPLLEIISTIFQSLSPFLWLFSYFNKIFPLLKDIAVQFSSLAEWIFSVPYLILRLLFSALWAVVLKFVTMSLWSSIGIFIVSSFQNSIFYRIISSIFGIITDFVVIHMEPSKLAPWLVSPIYLGVSKVLFLFPTWMVNMATRFSRNISGRERFVTDEEIALLSMVFVFLGLYLFCILGGGFLFHLLFFLSFKFSIFSAFSIDVMISMGVIDDVQIADPNFSWPWGINEIHLIGLLLLLSLVSIYTIYYTARLFVFTPFYIYRFICNRRKNSGVVIDTFVKAHDSKSSLPDTRSSDEISGCPLAVEATFVTKDGPPPPDSQGDSYGDDHRRFKSRSRSKTERQCRDRFFSSSSPSSRHIPVDLTVSGPFDSSQSSSSSPSPMATLSEQSLAEVIFSRHVSHGSLRRRRNKSRSSSDLSLLRSLSLEGFHF